jgi:hypothetical protein
MPALDEKIIHRFPTLEARATQAMADYRAGVADEATGKVKAIRAVIEYGKALLEGRSNLEKRKGNVSFKQWVTDNGFDVGKPWSEVRERSSAIQIASVFGSVPKTDFDACPYTTPSNIMKWYRKMLAPDLDSAEPKKSKTSKKSEPPQESKAPSTPATDAAYDAVVDWLRDGKAIPNQRKWADERKDIASHASFEKAFDRLNRVGKAETKAKANEDEALAKAEATFSEKSKLTVADAIRIHKARLDKAFEAAVNAEVRKRIDAADDSVRARLKKVEKENLQFQQERGKRGVFTEQQFNQMIMLCHPDDPASPATRAALLQVLLKNKLVLVNPEKK